LKIWLSRAKVGLLELRLMAQACVSRRNHSTFAVVFS
jgi:hypothetical protein